MRGTIAILGVLSAGCILGAMACQKRAPYTSDALTVVAIGFALAAALTPWIAA